MQKTYSCKVLSNNKKTGGFMVQAHNDHGVAVTRHLDANMRGKNPNDDAPKKHALMRDAISDKEYQLHHMESCISAFKKALDKSKKDGTEIKGLTIMDEAALLVGEAALVSLKADLLGLITQKHDLEDTLPLTAQFTFA